MFQGSGERTRPESVEIRIRQYMVGKIMGRLQVIPFLFSGTRALRHPATVAACYEHEGQRRDFPNDVLLT